MTSEDEAKILQDSAEGWKRANISRVKAEMERYGLQMSDLAPSPPHVPGLFYCGDSGAFIWTVRPSRAVRAGAVAGHVDRKGYRCIKFGGKNVAAHRLAWFYVFGEWPIGQIDHKDGNRDNNAIGNLRDVSGSENKQNTRRPRADNKLQILGVSKHRRKFIAKICLNGQDFTIGRFDTAEEAHQAYLKEKRRLHATCTI